MNVTHDSDLYFGTQGLSHYYLRPSVPVPILRIDPSERLDPLATTHERNHET